MDVQVASLIVSQMNLYVSVLGIVGTFILGTLAFLTWNHNEQRKKAQEALKEIFLLKDKMFSYHNEFSKLLKELREKEKVSSEYLESIKGNNAGVEKLTADLKKKDKNIGDTVKKINSMTQAIRVSADSLSTVYPTNINDVLTEAKTDSKYALFQQIEAINTAKEKKRKEIDTILEVMKNREKKENSL